MIPGVPNWLWAACRAKGIDPETVEEIAVIHGASEGGTVFRVYTERPESGVGRDPALTLTEDDVRGSV